MRIKYFVMGSQSANDGVTKKIFSQVSKLSQLGLNIELILISVGDVQYQPYNFLTVYNFESIQMGNILGRIKRAYNIRRIFNNILKSLDSGDILYHRYSSSLPIYYPKAYFKRFRTFKIVTEHQTKERNEFKLNHHRIEYISEYLFGRILRTQSDAIIGVTNEITQYEIAYVNDPKKPHLTIGNGFTVQSVPIRHLSYCSSNIFHLLCVANVSRWHGLDRLLRGIAAYHGIPRVMLHIAGDGSERVNLQKLAYDLGISDEVVFHGFLTGERLDSLFDQCHIAVGSLGIHRIGLKEASVLKAREYCARGIPFIYGIADPDFPADFPYVLYLPADESPIDIDLVLTFAKRACADPDHPKKMHRYAEEYLDWSVKMKKLKKFLETSVEGKKEENLAVSQQKNMRLE